MVLSSAVIFMGSAGSVAYAFLLSVGCIKAADRKDFVVGAFLSDVVVR